MKQLVEETRKTIVFLGKLDQAYGARLGAHNERDGHERVFFAIGFDKSPPAVDASITPPLEMM